jgi:excisionase family DNA binding protein
VSNTKKDTGKSLTLSSDIDVIKENVFDPSAWISRAKAAQLRGVSRQAIAELVRKNRFKTLKIGGKILLNRLEVETYQAKLPGREPKRRQKKQHRPTSERRKSTEIVEKYEEIEKLISQSEAARLRGVSKQAITSLISRGRLTSVDVAGHTLVLRAEIESFVAGPKGRPPKKEISKKASQKVIPKK